MSRLTAQQRDDLLQQIHEQTTVTNGRVTRLEEEVFGHVEHHTPGVIADVRDLKRVVYDARAVLRGAKWVIPIVVPGSVAAVFSAVKGLV